MVNGFDTGTVMSRRLAWRAIAMVEDDVRRTNTTLLDLTQSAHPQPPVAVRDGAKEALERGETHYTSRPGIPELRQAIAERSTSEGFPAADDSVVVTNGGSEALYIALQSVLQPGDRILIFGPVAPNILAMIHFIGAEAIHLPAGASCIMLGAHLVPDERSTALLLGSPSPVSGAAPPRAHLEEILAVAMLQGKTVILDRSLAWSCYNPALARFDNQEIGAKVLTTGSFSTAYDMAGWRVGYFTAPPEHIASMRELKQAMSICTSAVSQFAALAALKHAGDWLEERRDALVERRDRVTAMLQSAGLGVIEPDAWPWLMIDTRLVHPDDRKAAAMIARDAGVIVEPGSSFGSELTGYVRANLAAPDDVLDAAIERIGNFHSSCC